MNTNWQQINIPKDAFLSLLNNEFISDVKFRFTDGRTLFAHSFVLCCRSGKYYNLFVANIGIEKFIEVRDFTYEVFYEFLTYLYTNACQVDDATAAGVMKLSKKHSLFELTTQCTDVMVKELNVSNACSILESSIESEFVEVTRKTMDFIGGNYFAALSQDSFLKIANGTLQLILELEPNSEVDEFAVFERVMQWASQSCLTDGIEASGRMKRTKLGKNLKLIRFGSMSVAKFAKCEQLEPGLLEDKEALSIYRSIATWDVNPFGFRNKKRNQLYLTMLDSVDFNYGEDVRLFFGGCKESVMHFSVSHCVTLEQVKLFQMDNIVELKLQSCDINARETIYECPGPFIRVLNPKPKLQSNVKYRVIVQYSTDVDDTRLRSTTKHESRSGRYEFTLYGDDVHDWSNKCIKGFIFRE